MSEPVRHRKVQVSKNEIKLLMELRQWQRRVPCGEVVVQVVIKDGCYKCLEADSSTLTKSIK